MNSTVTSIIVAMEATIIDLESDVMDAYADMIIDSESHTMEVA
jgi:hypothetical protein